MPKIEQKHREEVRQHDMSFGAKLNSDGSFSFNFWAPSSQQVELCLFNESAQSAHLIKMTKEGEWFRLQTTEAKVGMEYAYRIDGDTTVPDPASRYQKTGEVVLGKKL
jgi:1,4-alpha-glucan branching enzyme